METIMGVFDINPVIEKYDRRYILGTSSAQLELFAQLLNNRIHIDGFVSEKEQKFFLFNKPIISMQEIKEQKNFLLITSENVETVKGIDAEVCSDIFVLNSQINKSNVIIYGAGKMGQKIEAYLREKHVIVQRFLDQNTEMRSWTDREISVPSTGAKLPADSSVILASGSYVEMQENLASFFVGKCFIPYEFMPWKYWLDPYSDGKFYTLAGDIYNICYHIMHNQKQKLVMYGTGPMAQSIVRLYELLDRKLDYLIEDKEVIHSADLDYEVREVEDVLYETSCFVLIAKDDMRAAYRKLKSMGLKYAKDFIVAVPFRVDSFFCRFNPLDTNLGYTYIRDSQLPGFTVCGGGV